MFQGFAEIIQPPYPNPSAGQRLTLEILVTGLESIFGLEIYTRNYLWQTSAHLHGLAPDRCHPASQMSLLNLPG